MKTRISPPRRRVGRVSYDLHHGSWYLYYRDEDLGIPVASAVGEEDIPLQFDNGKCILVTTFQKLFNAYSKFGTSSSTRPTVSVGALLVDNAHSCPKIAKEETTIQFDTSSAVYR